MACGIALKRSFDFDPLHNSNPTPNCDETLATPAKRRRYSIPQRCGSITPVTSTPPMVSPSLWRRYTPSNPASLSNDSASSQSPFSEATKAGALPSEQIVKHIYQEYKRIKKRKQLVSSKEPQQNDQMNLEASHSGGCTPSSQLPAIHLNPKNSSTIILPGKQNADTPLLSIKQVGLICERLLKEQQELLCSEYEKALLNKLSDQYNAFVKFSQDQLRQQLQNRPASYVS